MGAIGAEMGFCNELAAGRVDTARAGLRAGVCGSSDTPSGRVDTCVYLSLLLYPVEYPPVVIPSVLIICGPAKDTDECPGCCGRAPYCCCCEGVGCERRLRIQSQTIKPPSRRAAAIPPTIPPIKAPFISGEAPPPPGEVLLLFVELPRLDEPVPLPVEIEEAPSVSMVRDQEAYSRTVCLPLVVPRQSKLWT